MSEARIVGATTLTVPRSPLLLSERFDVVIVDEAGQISQPALLGALAAADSFILVGDHLQLPPLVQSELAEKAGGYSCWTSSCWFCLVLMLLYSLTAGTVVPLI
jgi:DNA replication ATP-dependent helicase Dna2